MSQIDQHILRGEADPEPLSPLQATCNQMQDEAEEAKAVAISQTRGYDNPATIATSSIALQQQRSSANDDRSGTVLSPML